MAAISSKIYEGEKDFQVMVDLLNKIRPANRINDYPAKVNIEECLANEEICANTKLWFDADQIIGWAFVDDSHNLLWELKKQYTESLGAEMVTWGKACIRKTLAEGETSTLDASCREDDKERLAFIRQHGFHQTDMISIGMKRHLSEPIPQFELPEGFSIRAIKGTEEAEAVASTHRSAFESEYMSTKNRLAIMNTSEYDPTLDLMVIAPDGSIAAYCTCSVNEQSKEGSTDPVATHPRFQRMGLAKALLTKGLQMLKERGMEYARLGTSGENIAMQKAAEAAGFFLEHKTFWFEKEVRN
jgi:ribosomal protein S18 acetylase RimI-like enzyme